MTRIPLTLGKHYLLIDSPISFYLVDNEENSVYRPSGVWQLDTWKLLPEKYQKDHPVYTLSIEYDESKLADGKEVLIRESDIDLGDGVAGVSGQAVMLTGINDSLLPISVAVSNLPDNQKVNVSNFPDNQKVNVSNFPDNQKVNVSNFPDIQKVNVQNQPTEIAVSNLNSIPAYPKEIAVNNLPDNQKVNVSNFPDNQKVNVSNFPDNQKVNVSNLPDNQKVNVSNFPDVQKVNVQNQPTEIAVSNLNSIPAYPKEIAVNNFPANQKVNVSNFPVNQEVKVQNDTIWFEYVLEVFSWDNLIMNLEANKFDNCHAILFIGNDMYYVHAIAFKHIDVVMLADKESTSGFFHTNYAKIYVIDRTKVSLDHAYIFAI